VELAHVRPILHAIATVVVPDGDPDVDRVWMEVEETVADALARRSERAQRQFEVFLRVVQMLPIGRYGRPFTALPLHHRRAVLERLERSRVSLLRRSFWGVRTLIFMGYYTRADVAESIGYQAAMSGWESRGGTTATIPVAPALWVEA
jgi:hypothetical protein